MTSSTPVVLLDSTLRDGEQAPGVAMTAAEKEDYVRLAEACGIRYLEVGFPSNPFDEPACRAACAAASPATRLVALSLLTPESVQRVADVGAHEALLIVPCSMNHIEAVYGGTLSYVIQAVMRAVQTCQRLGLGVNIGLEDAGARDFETLDAILVALERSPAPIDWITVADTRGQLLPAEVMDLMERVTSHIGAYLGARAPRIAFHAHNDLGLAAANSLAACTGPASAAGIHVTTLGFGERAGNAALEQMAAIFELKLQRPTGVDFARLRMLAAFVESAFLTPVPVHAPLLGRKVFMHESGLHQRGLLQDRASYQFVPPALVDRHMTLVLGKHSGKGMRRYLARQQHVRESDIHEMQCELVSASKAAMKARLTNVISDLDGLFIGATSADVGARLAGR